MKAKIEVIKGAEQRAWPLDVGRPATIGRSRQATIQVLEGAVSRLHCKLQFNGKVWILSDLDSRNGVWIGENRIKARAVCDGDIFSLGKKVFFRFRLLSEASTPAARPAPAAAARPASSPAPAPAPTPTSAHGGAGEQCALCGEGIQSGGVKGTGDGFFHPDCLRVSGFLNREIGGVRIIERLGGERPVHLLRAHQPSLNRHVLLHAFDRSLLGGDAFREKLLVEVRSVSRILHPRIQQIHDLLEEGEISMVVTEYFPGRPLREILERQAFVKVPAALRIGNQIAEGLAYAEEQGILVDRVDTRDIWVNDGDEAKLDYLRPPLPPRQDIISTSYLSPELIRSGGLRSGGERPPAQQREAATRSAVYSLGAILYHMLAGIPPHEGNSVEELLPRILQKTPPSLSRVNLKVSPALARLVERAMHSDVAQRQGSFRVLYSDLRKIVAPGL